MNIELNELQRICLTAMLKRAITKNEYEKYLINGTDEVRLCHELEYEINMQKSILELL